MHFFKRSATGVTEVVLQMWGDARLQTSFSATASPLKFALSLSTYNVTLEGARCCPGALRGKGRP
jgi:hypothetical protein